MLERGVNCPRTSSAGRLFDAVASLLDVQHINHYEGQAAMRLEHWACTEQHNECLPFEQTFDQTTQAWILDWGPMIQAILDQLKHGINPARIAAAFHNTLSEMMVAAAYRAQRERVALSGGTFQNRMLTERASQRLQEEGFQVYTHQQIPPNDGGISLGQYYALVFYHKQKEAVCV